MTMTNEDRDLIRKVFSNQRMGEPNSVTDLARVLRVTHNVQDILAALGPEYAFALRDFRDRRYQMEQSLVFKRSEAKRRG